MTNKHFSHYKIVRELGRGAMGVVYLAEDTQLQRRVALKFLLIEYTDDTERKARFLREARAAAAINHPNIITVYEVGEHELRSYIAMEYVDGKSLKDLMTQKDLSTDEVLDVAIQICEGLNEAHLAGIVHRDLKPANILISKKGQVKIADFGLAHLKGATSLTPEGYRLGTIPYMSPEQAKAQEVDQRSDIFSFGVVLYQLITRQLPFRGEDEAAIINAIFHKEPEPLARYKRNISLGMQSIIDKALDKDLLTRYQHITDLLADLRREKKQAPETITLPPMRKPVVSRIVTKTQAFIKTHRAVLRSVGIVTILLTILALFADLIQIWEFICLSPRHVSTTPPDQPEITIQPSIVGKSPESKRTVSPESKQAIPEYVPIRRSESEGGNFYIGKYEITNQEYMEFVTDSGYRSPFYAYDLKFNKPAQPVVGVSWDDAVTYCNWLSEKTQILHVLPTEEEWKRAAYGIEQREYPWGEAPPPRRANYGNPAGKPTFVGSYPDGKTPEGVFDMAGNVWEWCDTGFDHTNTERVIRGGSWKDTADKMRLAFRDGLKPDDNSRVDVGFRVVRSRR